jgi:hypothetical protein
MKIARVLAVAVILAVSTFAEAPPFPGCLPCYEDSYMMSLALTAASMWWMVSR